MRGTNWGCSGPTRLFELLSPAKEKKKVSFVVFSTLTQTKKYTTLVINTVCTDNYCFPTLYEDNDVTSQPPLTATLPEGSSNPPLS